VDKTPHRAVILRFGQDPTRDILPTAVVQTKSTHSLASIPIHSIWPFLDLYLQPAPSLYVVFYDIAGRPCGPTNPLVICHSWLGRQRAVLKPTVERRDGPLAQATHI
jgi:hypothetical protein